MPAAAGEASQISADGRMVFITVQLTVAATAVDQAIVSSIQGAVAPAVDAGLEVAYSGLEAAPAGGVDWTELVGLVIAFVVVAVTFGSFVAAGVPLLTPPLRRGVPSSPLPP